MTQENENFTQGKTLYLTTVLTMAPSLYLKHQCRRYFSHGNHIGVDEPIKLSLLRSIILHQACPTKIDLKDTPGLGPKYDILSHIGNLWDQ